MPGLAKRDKRKVARTRRLRRETTVRPIPDSARNPRLIGKIKSITTKLNPVAKGTFLSLLVLCPCAAENSSRAEFPIEVSMNELAGRGGWLIATVRLESGEELPMAVDAGTSDTMIDKSLEGTSKMEATGGYGSTRHFSGNRQRRRVDANKPGADAPLHIPGWTCV